MGVVSFACVSLLALLGNGLVTVKNSIGNTVNAQILQEVTNLAQVNSFTNSFTTNLYFDSEGGTTTATSPSLIYTATVNCVPLTNSTPISPSVPYVYNSTNSAGMLAVTVVNRTNPKASSSFSLIWPNSGK